MICFDAYTSGLGVRAYGSGFRVQGASIGLKGRRL